MPEVAVLVRSRDEARWIGRVLDAVLAQTVPCAVVVLDSGSTDGTLEEVRRRPAVRLEHIAPTEFTYGRALNRGFAACAGADVLVALSAHAVPADPGWLERLVEPLADPRVAGVYGRHLPHHDLDPFRATDQRRYWHDRAGDDTPRAVRFSNANAAVRATVWEAIPFDEDAPASEDRDWAERALAAGHRVVYRPDAAVLHSHREGPYAYYVRKRAQAAAGGRPRETPAQALSRWRRLVVGDLRSIARRPALWRWAPQSPLLRAAEVLADRAGPA